MFDLANLYAMTPRDVQLTPIGVLHFRDTIVQNAALLTLEYVCPDDRVARIEGVQAIARRDAAVTIDNLFSSVRTPEGQALVYLQFWEEGGATNAYIGQNDSTNNTYVSSAPAPVQTWLLPGQRIRVECNFSGAAANNTLVWSVWGFVIPRGNFAYA